MAQSALRPVRDPDQPLSLVERIDAEFPIGARLAAETPEPTVSSMAERFAPDTLRAPKPEAEPPLAVQPVLPGSAPAPQLAATPAKGLVAVLTGVALAPAIALGALLWFGTLDGADGIREASVDNRATTPQTASTETVRPEVSSPQIATPQPATHQATLAPAIAVLPSKPEIGLTAPEEILGQAGETVGFTIGIEGADALPPRSFISIRDLPDGASFSSGRPFGANEWNVGPEEVSGLAMHLPKAQSGASDLRVELVAADGDIIARTATRLDVAPPPSTGLVVRSGEEDRIASLMGYGQKMMDVGYLAGARAYYQRAAEAGSAKAALAVGATYDPNVLGALVIQGAKPDPKEAEKWYARAAGLGIADPQAEITAFKNAWVHGASEEASAKATTEAAPAPSQGPRAATEEDSGPLGRLVAAATELTSSSDWVEVSSPVNVRKGPSSNDDTYKVAQRGTKLRVLAREGNWVQISDPSTQQEGWIYRRFLRDASAP